MKTLLILLLSFVLTSATEWSTDYETAKKEAVQSKKIILLNFSGSDWCIPCMKMKKEIFFSDAFMNYAATNLVLVHADFPRQKKNQLSVELTRSNEALAEKFNPNGKFPYTLIIDPASGHVIKEFEGFPQETVEEFVKEINTAILSHK